MDRGNHYEAAVEAYLRHHRLGYVAVDEARRSLTDDGPVKSLDFIVHGSGDRRLLVDVKGRRFPGGKPERPRKVWENWSTLDDVTGLEAWEERFGPGYRGLLLFVYALAPAVVLPAGTPDLWEWREHRYLLRGIPVTDYRQHLRVRSPKWGTVGLPAAAFRELLRPFSTFTRGPVPPVSVPAGEAAVPPSRG